MQSLLPLVLPEYCERDTFGLEIANTISNAGFWIAGWRLRHHASRFVRAAAAWLFVVGACSALWHALHTNVLLLLLDSVPLYVLVLGVGYRVVWSLGGHLAASVVSVAIVAAAMVANAATVGTPLHVVSRHATAIVCLTGVVLWARRRDRALGDGLLFAIALYALALAAKPLDAAICPWLPIGTHFVWHLTGAAAAYVALRAIGASALNDPSR